MGKREHDDISRQRKGGQKWEKVTETDDELERSETFTYKLTSVLIKAFFELMEFNHVTD